MEPVSNLPKSTGLKALLTNDPSYAQQYSIAVTRTSALTASELSATYTAEYTSWRNRKSWARKNNVHWANEMNRFSDFLVVNGPVPKPTWTLDRIDPSGSYEPPNLRWASKLVQSRNRTNVHVLEVHGEQLTLSDIAKRTGKTYDTVRMALRRHGEGHVARLLSSNRAEAISSQELLWEFPEQERSVWESLYANRANLSHSKVIFFINALREKFEKLQTEARYIYSPEEKTAHEMKLNAIRKPHNDAVSLIMTVRTYARNERLYGHLKLEPQYDDPMACEPYNPYEDKRTESDS